MTYYYYIASDKPLYLNRRQLNFCWPVDGMEEYIKGFDVPIQLEMYSPDNEKELLPLYTFVKSHFERHPTSIVQIANYLNSNIEDCKIDKKKIVHLKKFTEPKQLALEIGELVTIKKQTVLNCGLFYIEYGRSISK